MSQQTALFQEVDRSCGLDVGVGRRNQHSLPMCEFHSANLIIYPLVLD